MADREGFHAISAEAHEGKTLPELLVPGIRKAFFALSTIEKAKDQAKRGLRVQRSFLSAVKISVNDVEYGITIAPEVGTADSGDIEADLPELMLALGEAAKASGRPVAILIDELQYLSTREFSALIMASHRLNQKSPPVILIGAGLPQILVLQARLNHTRNGCLDSPRSEHWRSATPSMPSLTQRRPKGCILSRRPLHKS